MEQDQETSTPAETDSQRKRNVKWPEWIQAIAAVLIVFITGFYTYYASVQAENMEKATKAANDSAKAATSAADTAKKTLGYSIESSKNILDEMKNQSTAMQEAANAADVQTKISNRAVKVAEDTLTQSKKTLDFQINTSRLDQRAWLGIGSFRVVKFEKGKPFEAEIEIINSGKTPGLHVTEVAKSGWLATAYYDPKKSSWDNESIKIPEKWFEGLKSSPAQSVPPQGRFYIHLDLQDEYFASLYDDIKSKKLTLFIYGEVRYSDIFGRSCLTRFCFHMVNPDNPRLFYCQKYNDIE